ncbi:MAG: DUF3418 domain-containing protein, partial [Acidimicrobiales bacterium]
SFRRMCRREFLNHNRLREWQDLYSQLKRIASEMKLDSPVRRRAEDVDGDAVHRAILTGLLSQIGIREETEPRKDAGRGTRGKRPARHRVEYIGARNSRFVLAPGSAIGRAQPRWVMAGELVETNRLYARSVAPVEPRWIEDAAEHLATYTYSEPAWNPRRGTATVVERATLYGLPVVTGRTINLHRVDPGLARELFIQGALVERDWETPAGSTLHAFLDHNATVLGAATRWEAKTRNRDLEIEAEAVRAHYDRLIPAGIVSVRHFEKWWKGRITDDPTYLDLSLDELLPAGTPSADFPDNWAGTGPPLSYIFEPGTPADGMTVTLSVAELRAGTKHFSRLVPGHRLELVTELLRTLPKDIRSQLVPLAESAAVIVGALPDYPADGSEIVDAIRHGALAQGVRIENGLLTPGELAPHLRPVFKIVDDEGNMLAAGRDPERLLQRLDNQLRAQLRTSPHPLRRTGLTEWPAGDLPRVSSVGNGSGALEVYPAVVDHVATVGVELFASSEEQEREHWQGVRRLVRFQLTRPVRQVMQSLPDDASLALTALANSPEVEISRAGVVEDIVNATIDSIMASAAGAPWSEADMRALVRFARQRFGPILTHITPGLTEILTTTNRIVIRIAELEISPVDLSVTLGDVRTVLQALVFDQSVTAQGTDRIDDVARYLKALLHRLERLPSDLDRDLVNTAEIHKLEIEASQVADPEIGWMLQELRVSMWAQHLGTDGPISAARIRRQIA